MDVQTALGRARQVIAVVMTPKLLAELGSRASRPEEERTREVVARFDWVDADGAVDTGLLGQAKDAVELLRSDRAVLHVGRITDLPLDAGARQEVSTAVVRLVFDRLGPSRRVPESTLNAALAMLVADVALVRRDAVDAGVLTRTADGSAYALRAE
ncbi:hypothetical protein E9228_002271 [Curtobacterium flaccumfaciens]|uniref:DUF2087 domain-containing protein n=1 Tax=Curtobacterium salicis TaxID=1779862 RepID=A0ABX0T9F0_9MICO|nr:DUF2087 domain-containing protein [Curtobacterium sp. WW7]NII41624.1 hypothetical protein [Curtobacterium sp. WW7]